MKSNKPILGVIAGLAALAGIIAVAAIVFLLVTNRKAENLQTTDITQGGTIRSDEDIDPEECNAVHNINACTLEELEALGVVNPDDREADNGQATDVTQGGPIRSDEGINPDECNAVHNINACTPEELEALGVVNRDEGEVGGSQFWVEMQDPQHGVGFAVPCYWEVDFPQEYQPGGSGISYPIRNYSDEYVLSFPRGQRVFENGGIKIDMNFMHGPSWGAPAGTSLIDFASGLYSNDSESRLVATEEHMINGQPALLVTTESIFGTGQFYLFVVTDEIYLLFGPNSEAMTSPDVLNILNSIALTSDISVAVPDPVPDNPPKRLLAPCMGITELPPDPNAPLEGCQAVSFASVEELASGLEENFDKANTGGLIFEYMNESIAFALWRSEGQEYSRNDFFSPLAQNYYGYQVINIAEGKPSQMTFTSDRSQFPPLTGIPAESMFGPDVNIAEVIYSEGWGQDGLGAALLFIAEDDCGRFYWHGLLYANEHFDK